MAGFGRPDTNTTRPSPITTRQFSSIRKTRPPIANAASHGPPRALYDKSIADYDEALRLRPQYATAYLNRGEAWLEKCEYDKSTADFDQAIHCDPRLAPAYEGRGIVSMLKAEYDKAIVDFNEAIKLDPRFALAYCNRGIAWIAKNNYRPSGRGPE